MVLYDCYLLGSLLPINYFFINFTLTKRLFLLFRTFLNTPKRGGCIFFAHGCVFFAHGAFFLHTSVSIQIFKNFMEIEEEIYLPSDTNQPQEHQALDYAFCSNKLGIIVNDELVILVTSTVVQEFANYVQGSQLKTDIESLSKAMNEDL